MSIWRVMLAGAENHLISGLDEKTKQSPNREQYEIIAGLHPLSVIGSELPLSPSRNPQPDTGKPTELNPNRSRPNHDHHTNATMRTPHPAPAARPTITWPHTGIEPHPQMAASTCHEGSYVIAIFGSLGVVREVGIAAIDRDTGSVQECAILRCTLSPLTTRSLCSRLGVVSVFSWFLCHPCIAFILSMLLQYNKIIPLLHIIKWE